MATDTFQPTDTYRPTGINPPNNPQYFHWSKEIAQPRFEGPTAPSPIAVANTSLGTVLEGAGEILKDTAKGMYSATQDYFEAKTEEAVRGERDIQTRKLESALSVVSGAPNESLTTTTQSPMGGGLPSNIGKDLEGMEVFKNARASGAISNTEYLRRVNVRLSDIRSQAPVSMWDAIDKKASSILGTNPANAQLASMTADLNDFIRAANSNKDRVENKLIDEYAKGNKAAGAILQQYRKDGDDQKALGDLSATNYIKWKAEQSEAELKDTEADQTLMKKRLGPIFQEQLEAELLTYQTLHQSQTQMDLRKAALVEHNPEAIEALKVQYANEKAAFKIRAQQIATKTLGTGKDGKPYTYSSLAAGGDEIKNRTDIVAGYWDVKTDLLDSPTHGAAHYFERITKLATERMGAAIISDPKLGPPSAMYLAGKGMFPEYTKQIFEAAMTKIYGEGKGGPAELAKDMMTLDALEATARAAKTPDKPKTLSETAANAKRADMWTPDVVRALHLEVIGDGTVKTPGLTNPKNDKATNQMLMDRIFHPDNTYYLTEFSENSQADMWATLTSKAVADVVNKDGDEKRIRNYTDWLQNSARFMLRRNILALNEYGEVPGIKVNWENDLKRPGGIGPTIVGTEEPKQPGMETGVGRGSNFNMILTGANRAASEVRTIIKGLSNFAESSGKLDPNVFVFNELTDMGYGRSPVKGIPMLMMQAIAASVGGENQSFLEGGAPSGNAPRADTPQEKARAKKAKELK